MITSAIALALVFVLWLAYRFSCDVFPVLYDYIIYTHIALGVTAGIFVIIALIKIVKAIRNG